MRYTVRNTYGGYTLPNIIISETFDFAPSSRVYTDNGFLRVKGKAARTGVYQYLASELGLADRAPNDVVNVLRSPDDVFNTDSLASYANVDVTNDHPSMLVDASNYKSTSVGHVIGATRDGDFVNVEMLIKDAAAIKDVESGKSQLSPGYTAVYVPEVGTYDATGEKYEFKQTDIKINHTAIVQRGRGGAQVRIDDNQGVTPMSIKIMLDSGVALEVADEASAKLVTDALKEAAQKVTDAEAKAERAEAERDVKDEELKVALTQCNDEAIAARVEAIAKVRGLALKIVGDAFTCDSVDIVTIQREALKAKRPTVDWDAKSDVYVQAAFDMAISEPSQPTDQIAQFSKDAAGSTEPKTVALSAYDSYKQTQADAWKGK